MPFLTKIAAAVRAVRGRAAAALVRLAGEVDLQDRFVFGGLACIGYGVHAVYPPAAWIIVGAALFWLGIRRG